jgi:hypothetical protein
MATGHHGWTEGCKNRRSSAKFLAKSDGSGVTSAEQDPGLLFHSGAGMERYCSLYLSLSLSTLSRGRASSGVEDLQTQKGGNLIYYLPF